MPLVQPSDLKIIPEEARAWAADRSLTTWTLFDRVDAVGVEGEMVRDRAHRRVGILVGPDGIDRAFPAERNAEIGAITLVRTIGRMIRPLEKRHVHVLAWNILDRWICRLAECQCITGVGDDATPDRDHHPVGVALDGNRMIRVWLFDRLRV